VWIAIKPDNAERIVAVLREFGFDISELSADLFLKENNIVRLGIPPMRIEIMTGISSLLLSARLPTSWSHCPSRPEPLKHEGLDRIKSTKMA
jgi:hypothetical protein